MNYCSPSGIKYLLDLREGIDFYIYLFGAFEPEIVRAYSKLLSNGSIVLDIGANIGAHTLPLSSCVQPNGQIFAIEPTDFAFSKLKKNVVRNPSLSASIVLSQSMFVPSKEYKLSEFIYSSWPLSGGGTNLDPDHCGALKSTSGANVVTLDDYVELNGIARVDLIKLDVDGNELNVIKGGLSTLHSCKPFIIMEFAPFVFKNCMTTFDEIVDLLSGLGYVFYKLSDLKVLPSRPSELLHSIPFNCATNVLATPVSRQL